MDSRAEILALVAAHSGTVPVLLDQSSLFGPGRLEGDDADDFWTAFAERFHVDLAGVRDYLHYNGDEPALRQRSWGVGLDGKRLPPIAIGVDDLMAAIEAGRWVLPYPEHRRVERPLIYAFWLPGMGIMCLAGFAAVLLMILAGRH